ncbi:MAG: transcription termination/antitermination factor NusG [Bacteroides sp.]|nr:transcription termination/antitermination factor NusG [Bacteroidales bacterium]MBD5222766.1 transcription termination/antitermination factor NusG [Bacteroidales bacterium]MBD5305974.1 transcription termination/antitermination factor NusG [Bacteroides sp.]MBD5349048.1 transcription termination/antitermination factor NusG [Bacteroides sp.]
MAEAGNKKSWYVLRAISGKEAKVKEVLDAAIKNTDLGLYVEQVLIPTQKIYTTRNGKKVVKERNLYPGYVFVEADLTGEVIYELRNTTNVIDFLRGRAKNSDPMALRESEVKRMLGTADDMMQPDVETVDSYMVGEPVKVTFGPFSGFSGVIKEVNSDRKKIKVEVKIFGRPTDLELENSQVERE